LFRWCSGHFEEIPNAQAAHFAALAALAPAPGESLHIRKLESALEHCRKIAAVVDAAGGHLARELARLELIAPAQLDAVDLHLLGSLIDQALHIVIAFRPAGAPIRGYLRAGG